MNFLAFLGKGALATATIAAGLGAGSWVNERVQSRPGPLRSTPAPASQVSSAHSAPTATMPAPATEDSLFHYKFVVGERLDYALDASIGGTGVESLAGPGSVAMNFNSDLYMITEGVDLLGNGDLKIGFDRVEMTGSFMDAPVSLIHSMAGTEFNHSKDRISTASGDSTTNIPQLEFFNKVTKAQVSPAGEVLRISGASGMEQMLSPEKLVTSVQFPAGDLDTGAQWESDFAMPIPGVGIPVGTKTLNVLEGFQLFRGRYCGVIRQTLLADQEGGSLLSPESTFGKEMGFAMPEFKLSGENIIYFDVDNGQLVQADMNLQFTLRIGQQLKPIADMLNLYGKLLTEIEGTKPGESQEEDLLDLGLEIQATLALLME